jgi:mitochondrial ribosomal protein L49
LFFRKYFLQESPYAKYNKEEREYLTKGIYDRSIILGIPEFDDKKIESLKPKVDPNSEPFRQIYLDTEDNDNFTQAQVLTQKEPELWYWVERLLPKEEKAYYANVERKFYPSGYKPPPLIPPNLDYFIPRTRAGIFPVYKTIEKTNRVLTLLNRVDGNIWKAAKSLRQFLEQQSGQKIVSSINEPKKRIIVKGDHVFHIIEWLKHKGF